jgi:lysozyme
MSFINNLLALFKNKEEVIMIKDEQVVDEQLVDQKLNEQEVIAEQLNDEQLKPVVEIALIEETAALPELEHAPSLLKVSETATEMVAFFEGFSKFAYKDITGIWTIGHGFTKGVKEGDTISLSKSLTRLSRELQEHADVMNRSVNTNLTQSEYDAIASFIFNLGGPAFTRSTLLRKINKGDKLAASTEFKRWNKAGGREHLGLTRRRYAEKLRFLNKDWREYDNEISKS